MACFIVPLTQAIATSVIRKSKKNNKHNPQATNPWISQLPKLELMLWGGTAMLIVDHIISGELTWQYPFFTAMLQKDGIWTMLHEMLTVGLSMSFSVTAIYCIMVAGSVVAKKRFIRKME